MRVISREAAKEGVRRVASFARPGLGVKFRLSREPRSDDRGYILSPLRGYFRLEEYEAM